MRKNATPQETYYLPVQADGIVGACREAFSVLATGRPPVDRRTPKTLEAGAPEDR